MTTLTENHNLCRLTLVIVILLLDAFLQLEHHRTSGINDLDAVSLCQFIGLWWFSVRPQQHLHVVQLTHLVVFDGDESHLPETVTLHAIVYDVTQTIEFIAFCKFLLSLSDGGGHAKAEAAVAVDFDYHRTISSKDRSKYRGDPGQQRKRSSDQRGPSAQQVAAVP